MLLKSDKNWSKFESFGGGPRSDCLFLCVLGQLLFEIAQIHQANLLVL